MDIEIIVKKVLFQLGKIKKVVLLTHLQYSDACRVQLEEKGMIAFASLEEAENAVLKDNTGTLIYIPALTTQEMMAIAAGLGGSPLVDSVIYLLLRNIPVHVMDCSELNQLKGQVKNPLIEKHLQALSLLEASGLVLSGYKETESCCESSDMDTHTDLAERVHGTCLLHEGHVVEYENNRVSRLILKKGTIITPLAQDKLRHSSVSIIRA